MAVPVLLNGHFAAAQWKRRVAYPHAQTVYLFVRRRYDEDHEFIAQYINWEARRSHFKEIMQEEPCSNTVSVFNCLAHGVSVLEPLYHTFPYCWKRSSYWISQIGFFMSLDNIAASLSSRRSEPGLTCDRSRCLLYSDRRSNRRDAFGLVPLRLLCPYS